MMDDKSKDYNMNGITEKLHEESKTKEAMFCPKGNNQLIIRYYSGLYYYCQTGIVKFSV